MNLLLVGGKLQGTEVAYLAKEAGWSVTLVDRRSRPLAALLCDEHICTDFAELDAAFLSKFDLVFPATENLATLDACQTLCKRAGVPLAFDAQAYGITSSKSATNEFLTYCGAAIPPSLDTFASGNEWPGGYIVKPDSESGSIGVERYSTRDQALAALRERHGYIGQAFLEGPVLSIEVVCDGAEVRPRIVTEVVIGEDYDCHRIVAPAAIARHREKVIRNLAEHVGRCLDMRGIFDIELIMQGDTPYILELDARFPSQTPIAIYHATGINLFVETARVFCGGNSIGQAKQKHAILQHARFTDGPPTSRTFELVGECQLKDAQPFQKISETPGAGMTLAARGKGGSAFYYTLVAVGETPSEAEMNLEIALSHITGKELSNDLAQRKQPGHHFREDSPARPSVPGTHGQIALRDLLPRRTYRNHTRGQTPCD